MSFNKNKNKTISFNKNKPIYNSTFNAHQVTKNNITLYVGSVWNKYIYFRSKPV